MITKGIIIDRISGSNKYRVRIPYLENAGMQSNVSEATVSVVPGISESLIKDDVVIVAFEDHQAGKPVIIGKLFINEETSRGIAQFDCLVVKNEAVLPESTTLGKMNLYKVINDLINKVNNLESIINNMQ